MIGVQRTDGQKDIMLATEKGMAIRFKESNVRSMGRSATGVRGVTLKSEDKVIGMVVADNEETLFTITENGYGKRTKISDYRLINRGGSGVINIKCTDKNGKVVSIKELEGDEDLISIELSNIDNSDNAPFEFSLIGIDVYIDINNREGLGNAQLLAGRNAYTLPENAWEFCISVNGWTKAVYNASGRKIGEPEISVSQMDRTINIFVDKNPSSWILSNSSGENFFLGIFASRLPVLLFFLISARAFSKVFSWIIIEFFILYSINRGFYIFQYIKS